VQVLFSSSSKEQTYETIHSDPRDEANSCWVVGKLYYKVMRTATSRHRHYKALLKKSRRSGLEGRNSELAIQFLFKVWLLFLLMSSIIIWNSCGIGGRDKKSCARYLVKNFSPDILGILDTKLENINDCTINSIWGRHSRDWYAVPSLGLSGGILCIWNPASFCVSNCLVAMNGSILHIEGVLSRFNLEFMVSFVYAPNDGLLKKEVWNYLASFKNSVNKPWCLAGDFNETLSPSDRKGSSKISSSVISFKKCIDSCDLVELPLNGKKFTWSRGNAASRIDRMFVTGDWLQHLPSSTLYGLPKNFSDHRPLHMLVDSTNWGPKPFRLMNCWWLNSDFGKMV